VKNNNANHWADRNANQIVQRKGEKTEYVCASGITPSGTVHIGNFREIISVELVVRALRDLRKKVRFIYSWDDFDVFRKVPANMPNQDELTEYLRRPITHVPDPHGVESSYARANECDVEAVLHRVGIDPEYLYQAEKYAAGTYAEGMRLALENESIIRTILNKHRSSPLDETWSPVSVFCSACDKDTTKVEAWDSAWVITYTCESCGNHEDIDLRTSKGAKLVWRIDWPMRWKYEDVDFEPAGKEHHSAGGSFDTAKEIVKSVYSSSAPVSFKYDFISIKGMGGKISSSLGNVVSLEDVLEIYQPEIVRFLFAGTRPDSEFAISFDLDVIKIYEDYDKCERIRFGVEEVGEKKRALQSRIYELSQISTATATGSTSETAPEQLPFRHLCNLLQIHGGDVHRALAVAYATMRIDKEAVPEAARERHETRAKCAWTWLAKHAPEDFRFALRTESDDAVELTETELAVIRRLGDELSAKFDEYDEKSLGELFYSVAEECGLATKELFGATYRVLLGKEKGPRLASFILTAGKERVLPIFETYRN
jgi:lysyl-tRNA synthetase, class I